MDIYVVPRASSPDNPKQLQRPQWKRCLTELTGRLSSKYRHQISGLLLASYSVTGSFPHWYHIGETECPTFMNRIFNSPYSFTPTHNVGREEFIRQRNQILNGADTNYYIPPRREGISGLEFDTKGVYLASVTKSGCLTVHDFETLYCLSNGLSPRLKEDETKHLLHLSAHQQLDVVRWNLANQDEVACTSMQSNEVLLFDIGYISSQPVEVLRKRPTATVHGCEFQKGLRDIAFTSIDKSRLLASDTYGVINIWDRRISNLPCLELTTNSHSTLNSIQLNVDNQIVFGAGSHGTIYAWDLRGGRTSVAFQSHKEVYHPPLISLKLTAMLEKIRSLKAQSDIFPKEIHSIDLDPSCSYQLAFHLSDGWSGVLDTNTFKVTHMHCPPPAWLNGSDTSTLLPFLRKPSWLPTCSVYAVASSSDDGIHLLDFYPDSSSACHVDLNEDIQNVSEEKNRNMQNRFVPLSEDVTVCAAHPLNGAIIAGTKHGSLLMISQRRRSYYGGDCTPSNEGD